MSCSYCCKQIRNRPYINCSLCNQSIHVKCSYVNVNNDDFDFSSTNNGFYCKYCIGSALPFNHIVDDDEFLHEINQFHFNHKISFGDLQKLTFNPFTLNDSNDKTSNQNINYNDNDNNETCNYYYSDTFNNLTKHINEDKLSLIHFNSRSLNKNIDNITDYLKTLNHKFPLIAFSETWLNDSNSSPALNSIDGYNIAHCHRNFKRGGGVALYISNDLNFKIRHDLNLKNSDEYESVFVEIESHPKNTIVGVIYRPPDRSPQSFIHNLSNTVNLINNEKLPSFICGDFNINLLKISTHQESNDFLNIMYEANYYPTITKPTRLTTRTSSLIDNIFSNILNNKLTPGILFNDITDHFPVFYFVNKDKHSETKNKSKNNYYTKRKITNITMTSFENELNQTNWNEVLNNSSADDSYDVFINKFTNLYDKHFPKVRKKINKRKENKPWISAGIIKSIKTRNKLYIKFIKNPTELNKSNYVKYRNKLTNLIKVSCKTYYSSKFNEYKSNIKHTWQTINSVIGKNSKPKSPSYFLDGTHKISDPGLISNKFNSFFANIGPELASKIQSPSVFSDFLNDPQPNTIFFHPTDEKEIFDIVKTFKNGKSAGYDDVSPTIVKRVIPFISHPLAHIFNLSLSTGVFPSALKLAKVIPIFKKDDPHTFSNYRPISLLPCFSKILERLVYNRLDNFLTRFHILHNNQYGFRKHHSTDLALLDIYNKISSSLALNHHTIGIFLDLSKAFDTINHDILLSKLHHYGIRGLALDLLSSYLSDRFQFTSFDSHLSDRLPVSCGVPQGSILGPLLFLLYVNDIPSSSKHFSFVLFADDTNIFLSHPNLNTLTHIFNRELIQVSNWFKANKLSLNVKKTNYIHFTKKKHNTPPTHIMIDNTIIHPVEHTKFLGVIIDQNLSWKFHISKITNQISKNIGILRKLRNTLPKHILFSLYNTLILPYISYSNIAWAVTDYTLEHDHCPWTSPHSTKIDNIFKLQKRALRIINNTDYSTHTKNMFHDLKTLNIFDLNKLQTALFMFRYHTNTLPKSFSNCFKKHSDIHNYNTRHAKNYIIAKPTSNLIKNSIQYTGPKLWNSLSSNITNSKTQYSFKSRLKQDLINKYA
jgi:exonuclease III